MPAELHRLKADPREWFDAPEAPEARERRVRCPSCWRRVPPRVFVADRAACSACIEDAGEEVAGGRR